MKLFSVHDSKANYYLNPMTYRNAGEAVRNFETVVNDSKSQFFMYPADFTLVELAEFDSNTGSIVPHDKPVILGNASDLKKQD